MWAIPTGTSSTLGKKNQVKSPSICSRTPNLVRIRQSDQTGNRGVTKTHHGFHPKHFNNGLESIETPFTQVRAFSPNQKSQRGKLGFVFLLHLIQIRVLPTQLSTKIGL